ncbi:MAG: hypothetical protein MUE52_17305 [Tabrizicola sp.]|nr:hypothetical protein [Tabrizicola sp.]
MRMTSDDSLELELISIAEPIQLNFEQDRLVVGFRSSNGGPGYHAAVIDLLDQIAAALSVTWQWVASDGTHLDETGYATTRDFAALQSRMADFLLQLCGSVTGPGFQAGDEQGISLCTPLGLGHQPGKVSCPLGFKSRDWPAAVVAMDDAARAQEAAGFFVWWHEGLTGATWVQLLRAQLWQNAEWRPAVTENDRLVRDQIRHSYARAVAGKAMIPDELEAAYQQYLTCQSASDPPAEDGIGYRKYPIWAQPFKHWALSLPGYLSSSDQDGTLTFEHPAFWLGLSSLSIAMTAEDAGPFSWPDRFDGPLIEIRPGILCRKSAHDVSDGTSVQGAMIWTSRGNTHQLLILTLSSGLDWPFDAFDSWIMSVTCPDTTLSTHHAPTLH